MAIPVLSNMALTGVPTAPTATVGTNTTQLATTAFVLANPGAGAVTSVFGRTGVVTAAASDLTNGTTGTGAVVLKASPTITGTATVLPDAIYLNSQILLTETAAASANPAIKLYRTTGGSTSYPVWLSVDNAGNLNFQTGVAAVPGSETVATVASISSTGFTATNINVGSATQPYGSLQVAFQPGISPTYYWDTATVNFEDNRPMAAGVGGGILLQGNYITGTGSEACNAGLQARKTNATSADPTTNLDIWSRGGAINFATNPALGSGYVAGIGVTGTSGAPLVVYGVTDTTGCIALRLSSQVSGSDTMIHFTDNVVYNTAIGTVGGGDFCVFGGRYPTNAGTERFRVSGGTGVISTNTTGDAILLNAARSSAATDIVFCGSTGANDARLSSNNDGTLNTATFAVNGNLYIGTLGTNNLQIGNNTATTISGVTGSLFGVAQNGIAWKLSMDTSGNMGISGSMSVGVGQTYKVNGTQITTNALSDVVDWTTYTPSIAASLGTFTTASAVGLYKKIGRVVFFTIVATVTTVGSGTTGVTLGLPVAAATRAGYTWYAMGWGSNSSLYPGKILSAATTMTCVGTTVSAGGTVTVSGHYESAT